MAEKYDPKVVEDNVLKFWDKNQIYPKAKSKGKGKKKYYFLDGPPYTSGRVHIGTAWNKSLKDMILRYKRMQGLDVWDRAGYDMHGLPTAQKVMAEKGLKTKEDIEKFGVGKFINECEKFSLDKMELMNKDFIRMGVWMDFADAYMPITKEFIDGEWWLIKKAYEQGRLYEDFRTLAWDYVFQTSLAKHELEYHNVTDTSIFVKFKVLKDAKGNKVDNEYLVIWTTTPWTIPFNLGIMVNPELEYLKLKVKDADNKGNDEVWIMSKGLGPTVILSVCDKKYGLMEEFLGTELEGMEFEHPFYDELKKHYDKLKKDHPKVHTVVLSSEYVDLTAGTGLVHMAPGCGPEDYEVGHKNNIPAWNVLLENGDYPEDMGEFSGKNAKEDNLYFKDALDKRGVLIAENEVEHEYPFGQRSHAPVIFRATKQWFFKVEDIKDQLIKENNQIKWVPEAAYNAFNSWLNNLRDNSITKQNYWGTPVPIWRNIADPDEVIVVGSIAELEKLSGQKVDNPHKPWIDEIMIKKDGKTFKRIPDILDVWVDAGTAAWSCIDYPKDDKLFNEMYPADFILEGKDQIRGWFNLLHVASMLGMKKKAFKNCYMHGFVQDAQGRKMSKSLGNQVSPYEVIDEYGADTLRYYMISGANPGVDINYNFDDVKSKSKNLHVLWNLQNLLLDLIQTNNFALKDIQKVDAKNVSIEERYMLSKLNSCIKNITKELENYNLYLIPTLVEELFLELSRTYIQLVREKVAVGEYEEKKVVVSTIYDVLIEALKMFSIVCPFISETIYLNLKEKLGLDKESIHLFDWPKHDEKAIDSKLEEQFQVANNLIQSILFAREKIATGVRWPLSEVVVETKEKETITAIKALKKTILTQTNIKEMKVTDKMEGVKIKLTGNFKTLGPLYGEFSQSVVKHIAELDNDEAEKVLYDIEEKSKHMLKIVDKEFEIKKENINIEREIPEEYVSTESRNGLIFLNKVTTPELEAEGFAREMMRRIQAARKKHGLNKSDEILLYIRVDSDLLKNMKTHESLIKEKCGAKELELTDAVIKKDFEMKADEKIKGKEFSFGFDTI